jgi:3-deoxy-7-phosphoheptulonate synthase
LEKLGNPWSPHSWQGLPIEQQPNYKDQENLGKILKKISEYPPLVFAGEIEILKKQLAKASDGRAFLLQGGDCAERFEDCHPAAIKSKLKILLQMSVVLCYGAKCPVIRVGRMAGQYAKPRSAATETVDGEEMEVFRGDNINSFEPVHTLRIPDPARLLQGYHLSSLTLNYIRALTTGGFADLHRPQYWDLDFVNRAPQRQRYEDIIAHIKDAISFTEALSGHDRGLDTVQFFTSHEGLLLNLESSLTHYIADFDGYYNLGAHMLWIGARTLRKGGAHIEYFRGIKNPLGIKIGPTMDPKELVEILQVLNPSNESGRITLITRMGSTDVARTLAPIIRAVQASEMSVLWSVDPMHGNATKTQDNVKTRNFDDILSELRQSFAIHQSCGTNLGGVHFELTGENVTECVGGSENITAADLCQRYETFCDPRLNYSQSLEMAFLISSMLQGGTDY